MSTLKEIFKRRFSELEDSFYSIQFSGCETGHERDLRYSYSENGEWHKWATSAQNIILSVFGEKSPHYNNFVSYYNKSRGLYSEVNTLKSIFASAKEDFDGGYVFDIDLRVSGEIFGDFVSLAKQTLSEGHKDVAAVLACAALEDALKRYAIVNGLDVAQKTMTDVVNLLKANGLVSGAQKTLLEAMPKIRNLVMHAEWSKISDPEVSSVIGYVEQFLLSKFS